MGMHPHMGATPQEVTTKSSMSAFSAISSDNQLNFDNQPVLVLTNGSGVQVDPVTEVNILTQVVLNTNSQVLTNAQSATALAVGHGHASIGTDGHSAHADANASGALGTGLTVGQEVSLLVSQ